MKQYSNNREAYCDKLDHDLNELIEALSKLMNEDLNGVIELCKESEGDETQNSVKLRSRSRVEDIGAQIDGVLV